MIVNYETFPSFHWKVVKSVDHPLFREGITGGTIEDERNLAQEGECWVYPGGAVREHASVQDKAKIFDGARIEGNVVIGGESEIGDSYVGGSGYVLDSKISNSSMHLNGLWITDCNLRGISLSGRGCIRGVKLHGNGFLIDPFVRGPEDLVCFGPTSFGASLVLVYRAQDERVMLTHPRLHRALRHVNRADFEETIGLYLWPFVQTAKEYFKE